MHQHLLATALGTALLMGTANGVADDTQSPSDKSEQRDPRLLGGATTVLNDSRNAYSLPARNLGILRRDNFFIGNAFFKQPWVIAPASTSARDGLGPLFNANTCQGCHVKDGRGRPPLEKPESFQSILVRLSIPATTAAHIAQVKHTGVVPEPNYGDQLQPNGILSIKGEGIPSLTYSEINGKFNDGTAYSLLKPTLHIDELNYGDLHDAVLTSVRVAPAMIGMGLLATIPETALLAQADPDDKDGDGISGRPNRVWDHKQQKTVVGRFGWKANQPTVEQQSAGAFQGDMGLSTVMFPAQPCTPAQTKCQQAPHGGEPEVSAEIFEKVVFYASTLAVPAQRDVNDEQVLKGKQLFNKAACIRCHTAAFTTGENSTFPELSKQYIRPYTDLLLHDMGEGLADGRPDFEASGREWRTPPLWGIGLVETVNNHTRFLHDGRARNLMEAILWHGGEAEQAKQSVLAMDKAERDALITFLNSL